MSKKIKRTFQGKHTDRYILVLFKMEKFYAVFNFQQQQKTLIIYIFV